LSPRPVAVPRDEEPRIDTPLIVRQASSSLASRISRINGLLGRTWTTPGSVQQAKEELLAAAEEALAMRRMLCS
jgi:hypothetical protein